MHIVTHVFYFFFFNDTATTEIYTLSLHDALPIWREVGGEPLGRPPLQGPSPGRDRARAVRGARLAARRDGREAPGRGRPRRDRKSTRLNSSHLVISYAVFCLKKKNTPKPTASTEQ